MSKRHQANRRKTYGRRQHEVRERSLRRRELESLDVRVERFGGLSAPDAFGFDLEPAARQYRFATGD
jgi:hypothetical protein